MRGFSMFVRKGAHLSEPERRLDVYDPAAMRDRLNRSQPARSLNGN